MNCSPKKPANGPRSLRFSVQISVLKAPSVAAAMSLAQRAGLDGIELFWVHCQQDSQGELQLGKLLAQCQLAASAIYVPFHIHASDPQGFREICEATTGLGCGFLNVGGGLERDKTGALDFNALADEANRMADTAADHGLAISLHTQSAFTLNGHHPIKQLVEAGLDGRRVGLCLDPWEIEKAGNSSLKAYQGFASMVNYAHLNNGRRDGEETRSLLEGDVPLERICHSLFHGSYAGWITFDSCQRDQPLHYLRESRDLISAWRKEFAAASR